MRTKYITIAKKPMVNADIFKYDYIFLPANTIEEAKEIQKLNETVLADMIDARHQKRIEESKIKEAWEVLHREAYRELLWLPIKES